LRLCRHYYNILPLYILFLTLVGTALHRAFTTALYHACLVSEHDILYFTHFYSAPSEGGVRTFILLVSVLPSTYTEEALSSYNSYTLSYPTYASLLFVLLSRFWLYIGCTSWRLEWRGRFCPFGFGENRGLSHGDCVRPRERRGKDNLPVMKNYWTAKENVILSRVDTTTTCLYQNSPLLHR
jgi:hypothetical protein